jgi:hypothetical protein
MVFRCAGTALAALAPTVAAFTPAIALATVAATGGTLAACSRAHDARRQE